ncbi:hypothetical protein NSA50_18780 [Clostridium sp. DSM 100503]|uniref:hypothetical protein n=1 Tax=Clostridium sp. DSM 100503 TaxID=2963282 RepID=UPI00214A4FFD|nr:hypothetical protein [Clostridium sp. DSM 100503]MCR1953048.1 hypothetical protein [Clostridium sp. DSM 100503]
MTFRIYYKVNDVLDSITIEGDSIDEIRAQVNIEIVDKRRGKPLWSERVGD